MRRNFFIMRFCIMKKKMKNCERTSDRTLEINRNKSNIATRALDKSFYPYSTYFIVYLPVQKIGYIRRFLVDSPEDTYVGALSP